MLQIAIDGMALSAPARSLKEYFARSRISNQNFFAEIRLLGACFDHLMQESGKRFDLRIRQIKAGIPLFGRPTFRKADN
jgi:hypothetical protein